jgi:hypothetical protein
MTDQDAKDKVYNLLANREGQSENEFILLLTKTFGESGEFWKIIVDDLLTEDRICRGYGMHTQKKAIPEILLFTDKHPTKCVATI